jgi:hypothetical protein
LGPVFFQPGVDIFSCAGALVEYGVKGDASAAFKEPLTKKNKESTEP